MKSIIAGLLLTFALTSTQYAQEKTEFSKIWDTGFNTYQSAEDSLSEGNKEVALKNFKQALEQFNKIKTADLTSWQEKIIAYRIGLCKSNIKAIVSSINTGAPIKEVAPAEPVIKQDTAQSAAKLEALKKQRQSIEDTLKIYIDKYNQEVTSNETLKLDLSDATKEVHKYKAFNKVLSQKLSDADKQLQEQIVKSSKKLETKLKAYEAKLTELKSALSDQKVEKENIQAYVESKEAEHDKLSKQLELLRIDTSSTKEDLAGKLKNIEFLKAKVQTLEANLAATKETTARTNEYASSQKLYIAKLKSESEGLKVELQNTIKILKDNQEKLESGNKENFQLKMFIQEKIDEKNKLTAKVEELTKALKNEKAAVVKAKDELIARTEKDKAISEVLAGKGQAVKKLESQIKVKDASIAELKEQYKTLQMQFVSFKTKSAQEAAVAETQSQYIVELQNQMNDLQKTIDANKKIVAAKDKALSQGQQGTSKLKEAIKIELTEKETIKATMAKLLDEKATQADDIKKLKSELAKLESDKREYEELIAKEKDENVEKSSESSKLKMALAKAKMELSTKDVDIAILNEQVIGLQNKLNMKASPLVKPTKAAKKAIQFAGNEVTESTKTGTLYRIRTKSTYITHALVDANRKPLCYVHFSSAATQFEGKKITISGLLRTVKGWKAPILDASKVSLVK